MMFFSLGNLVVVEIRFPTDRLGMNETKRQSITISLNDRHHLRPPPQNNKSMLDNLNSELSGNARKIIVMLLLGQKSESEEVSSPTPAVQH